MIKDLLQERITAKWWNDSQVEDKKLKYILDCIYNAPSKNGNFEYEVFVSKSEEFKNWLYYKNTCCLNGVRGAEGDGVRRYNGQVLAPVILTWIASDKDKETYADCIVSATIAMVAAEEIGLQTGFCGCIEPGKVAKKLDRSGKTAAIILGIGYIDQLDTDPIRKVYKDGVELGWDHANVKPNIAISSRNKKPDQFDLIKFYR